MVVMEPNFRNVKRESSLVEQVVDQLKEVIFSGQYKTGDLLPSEIQLTRQMGVSRPVVREAIKILESRGLLEVRRGTRGGPLVADMNRLISGENLEDLVVHRRISIDDLAQFRLFFEPEVARLAAERASESSIEILETNIDRYFKVHDKNTRESLNFEFHRILGQICGNPFYAMLTNSIMDFTYNFLRVITPKWKMLHNDSDHKEIFLAIKERNPEKAMLLLRDHILRIVEEMRRLEKQYSRLRDKGDKEA
jgi:GntR family transcriptional regulator, transcriptional repressor for pyruvate dehydrogenase complex